MGTYAGFADLPLRVDECVLEGLTLELPSFTRRTTVVHLRGGGEEGVGEDVTYDAELQLEHQRGGAGVDLAGEHTLESFSQLVADVVGYRRWGYESAALDLALRQAGTSLWE
ncbi:MAG TPA: hypothetical protein VIU86_13150, partial [Gaiellaceae bacterium]